MLGGCIMTGRRHLNRARSALALAVGLAGLGAISPANSQSANPMTPVPIPAQVPAQEGVAQLAGTQLWYWDTGGSGTPIVLMHPATGSGLIWVYQQPVFAKAGYRVIGYSRRGYINSAPFDRNNPGTGSEDLRPPPDPPGLRRFHPVASAAGGSRASDLPVSHQARPLRPTTL